MSGIIDAKAIEALQALNPDDGGEFVREVVGIFLSDTPDRIAAMVTALAGGDAVVFAREAHSIKGSSASVGATALRAAAEDLEHRARREGLAGVAPGLERIKVEFAAANTALSALVKGA